MSMFDNIKFPFLTHQQLNLDWILAEIKRILRFFPEEGDPGTVLMKTEDGASWEGLPAIDININGVPEDIELTDTDKLIFYDVSSSANRKITAPNLLNSMMSNGTPLMDGTGSAGTSKKPARYDHRHPTDTTRAPASYFQNNALKIENGGTGATTAAGAVTALGLDAEMGTNYIKFPWGVMIQFGEMIVNSGENTQIESSGIYYFSQEITMPVSFVNSQYVVFASSRVTRGFGVSSGCYASTPNKFSSYNYDFYKRIYSDSVALSITYCAIGKWK